MNFAVRIILSFLAAPYVVWLIFCYQYHFIDGANLVFHEAGHMVLLGFGQTIHFLGGTIGQLTFPIVCCVGFIKQKQKFEAAVSALWLGENLLNIAWYMGDAQARKIPLVGGGIHDWHWLLSKAGILSSCNILSWLVHITGSTILIISLVILFQEAFIYKKVETENES